MAQPFYRKKVDLKIGPRKDETVYCVQAYYYGTITTKLVATQIAQESALTQAGVKKPVRAFRALNTVTIPLSEPNFGKCVDIILRNIYDTFPYKLIPHFLTQIPENTRTD